MAKKITLWAFWRYDLYPYCLGAEVVQTNDDGSVYCKGWDNSKIYPSLLVPGKPGEQLLEELKSLKAQYRARKNDLAKQFRSKARQAFNALGVGFGEFPILAKENDEAEEQ